MIAPIFTAPLTLDQALAIIAQQQQLIEQLQLRIAELEERLKLDSRTSSKPPSSDGPAKPPYQRKPSGKKRGAQPGHKGSHRAMLLPEQVDGIVDCPPPAQCSCGATIQPDDRSPLRHQVFDLPPIQPIVTEYRQWAGVCTGCGRVHRGPLPVGVPTNQLGPNALALLGTLSGQCHLTQRKIQGLFRDAFGLDFSIGAISEAHAIVAEALAAPVAEMGEAIRKEAVKHADETSHQSHGMHFWLWTAVTRWGALFQIKSSRGKLMAQALLGDSPDGVVVTDRYASYHWIDAFTGRSAGLICCETSPGSPGARARPARSAGAWSP